MKRLNILREGYIYPKEERPVRDILRRRLLSVRHRTAHILSLQSSIRGNLDHKMSSQNIKRLEECDADTLFDKPFLMLLKNSGSEVPYFAMWINNPELLIPW